MWSRCVLAFAGAASCVALLGGCGAAAFACEQSEQCAGAEASGVCEPDGWCSFPDASCDSGRRYGELAGDGRAGQCTDVGGTGGGDTGGSTTTLPDPTLDPTLASLEGTSPSSSSSSSSDATTGAVATCGDGVLDVGEDCDDGVDNGTGGPCRGDCVRNTCGDGYVGEREQCDGTQGCGPACTMGACGDGVVDLGEACDPAPGEGVSCESLGWTGGEAVCVDCEVDATGCIGCGPDGCMFEACAPMMGVCPAGESCLPVGDQGICTAECARDDDCPSPLPAVCFTQMGLGVCLPTCVDGGCPEGMVCFDAMPPVCIFM